MLQHYYSYLHWQIAIALLCMHCSYDTPLSVNWIGQWRILCSLPAHWASYNLIGYIFIFSAKEPFIANDPMFKQMKSNDDYYKPNGDNPNCVHTTATSLSSQPFPHIVLHIPLIQISTSPTKWLLLPVKRIKPCVQLPIIRNNCNKVVHGLVHGPDLCSELQQSHSYYS